MTDFPEMPEVVMNRITCTGMKYICSRVVGENLLVCSLFVEPKGKKTRKLFFRT